MVCLGTEIEVCQFQVSWNSVAWWNWELEVRSLLQKFLEGVRTVFPVFVEWWCKGLDGEMCPIFALVESFKVHIDLKPRFRAVEF